MRKILLPIVLLFCVFGYSQFITVNESLTVQELVEDILINSPCAVTSNYSSITGTDFGEGNGIASFDANGSNFPYQTGIILSSGFVSSAPGPNLILNSDGGFGWPGDADLEANTTATNTNNASYIQFDFVPFVTQISFNFLFASEEYNQNFECQFSDAFAFILTDQITGMVQNLAVLPGTNIPIEVTNIHPDVPGQCPAINEIYFDKYNFEPFNIAADAAIDFNGQILSLTAQGDVIIGNPYTIKLVIADEEDTLYDSVVFLEAGSFNIGVDIGPDVTIANGNAPCTGQSYEIGLLNPNFGDTYRWFVWNPIIMIFELIPGEIDSTLIVTQSGIYQIEVTLISGCVDTDEIIIEFAPQPIAVVPDDIIVCDTIPNDGFAEFDLTIRDAQIQNGQPNTFVEYYFSMAAAEAGIFPFVNPSAYTNTSPGFQIVFARLEEIIFGCYDIVPLVLQVDMAPAITDPISDYFICDNDGDGVEVFDLTTKDAEILNILINVTLTYHNLEGDALTGANPIMPPNVYPGGDEIIWVRTENLLNCVTVGNFLLVLGEIPLFVNPIPFEQCDDEVADGMTQFDLNLKNAEISNGNTDLSVTYYNSLADAQAAINPLPIPYTNSVNPEIIWVRIEDNITGCYGTTPLVLIVLPNPIVLPITIEVCDDDNDGFYFFILSDYDDDITGGDPDLIVRYYGKE
ncbi:MAG: choice-of-anchor L domain-containing protein, partial [Bacteroidetes bacterium]|nr:choice-of-anchor L domain-containing protein [Bacteroidota bacterium]